MGWRPAARLPTIFLEALKTMKVGQTSEILRSPAGFHIIKLLDKRGNDTPVIVTQTHARHILIRLNEVVSENDAQEPSERAQGAHRERRGFRRAGAAAIRRSPAPRAAAIWAGSHRATSYRSSSARWMRSSQGRSACRSRRRSAGISCRCSSGASRTCRRTAQRLAARQAIRQRKSEDQWQEWIRQQRDKAYVEYHLEDE